MPRVLRSFAGAILPAALALAACVTGADAAFRVQGVFQFGPAHVGIAFTDSVDIASALQASGYVFTPQAGAAALAIQTVAIQENQRTVVITTTAALPRAATYGVEVQGVRGRGGEALEPGGPGQFTTVDAVVTGIAEIHADVNNLIGKSRTVIGQVYITGKSSGGTPSGYIQDGTGRGLNVFGNPVQPAIDTLGNVVMATGTVALYFTTVELTPFTAVQIASQMPHLGPRVLTVEQASSAQWEGTYIQTTATLTFPGSPSGANNYNYPATDGTRGFYYRVRNSTGIPPSSFHAGDIVTGLGAGTNFQGTYQITVGNAGEFYHGAGPGDETPPVLVSASGVGGSSTVTVEFSEPVGAGAATPGNYKVYPTGAPGSDLGATAAAVAGSFVTLTLATPLTASAAYTVEVSGVEDSWGNAILAGSTLGFTASVPVPFRVAGIFPFGSDRVGVAFTKPVNAGQALNLTHYAFTPGLAIAQATLQENGQTVILRAAAALPTSSHWTVAVTGVTSATGESLNPGADALDTGPETVLNIAELQENVGTWAGQSVTVIGQVTIPVGSRGGTPNGYIQDGSGRGVNLFGGTIQGSVNQLGSVAKVTGTVLLYFTTTEITSYTATALATGLPHLGAKALSMADAGSASCEGTYIECTGTLTAIDASTAGAVNYVANDGSPLTFRVGNGLGLLPSQFATGDVVTGRGAGASYQTTWQIQVGNTQDFFRAGSGGPDETPPVLTGASGAGGSASVRVTFSEALRSNEATLPSSWSVYPSADPLAVIAVLEVVLAGNGRSATLTLAAPLAGDVSYTVRATGVYDLAGNPMAAGAAVSFMATTVPPAGAELQVAARTLLRNMTRQGEVMAIRLGGVPGTRAVCRVFDLQGRVVRVLFDATLGDPPRRTVNWDGRDDTFEFVPAGLYVCHLQTTDDHGSVSEARVPIVVAVRLE